MGTPKTALFVWRLSLTKMPEKATLQKTASRAACGSRCRFGHLFGTPKLAQSFALTCMDFSKNKNLKKATKIIFLEIPNSFEEDTASSKLFGVSKKMILVAFLRFLFLLKSIQMSAKLWACLGVPKRCPNRQREPQAARDAVFCRVAFSGIFVKRNRHTNKVVLGVPNFGGQLVPKSDYGPRRLRRLWELCGGLTWQLFGPFPGQILGAKPQSTVAARRAPEMAPRLQQQAPTELPKPA